MMYCIGPQSCDGFFCFARAKCGHYVLKKDSLEYCEKQKDEVQEQLDYWKKVVAEHEDQSLKIWGPDDFSVGQRILAHGRPAVIVKVNFKT
jgi:hypothetical protein